MLNSVRFTRADLFDRRSRSARLNSTMCFLTLRPTVNDPRQRYTPMIYSQHRMQSTHPAVSVIDRAVKGKGCSLATNCQGNEENNDHQGSC